MSEKYFTLIATISAGLEQVQAKAFEFGSTGVQEFSLEEAQVDDILGVRSYSGADIPESVIDEVVDVAGADNQYTFYFNTLENVDKFKKYLSSISIEWTGPQELVSEDWNAKWRETYVPIEISEELVVVPSWQKSNAKKPLYIYPGRGFGTGSHETTYLCLKVLTQIIDNYTAKTCMDFGCGSGILGLATYHYCPDIDVDFYDIDSEALENTVQNFELNKFLDKSHRLLLPKDRTSFLESYDIVFANILKNILEIEAKSLIKLCNENGYLILSGLLKGQEEDIIKLYQSLAPQLSKVSVLFKNDWVCICFKKIC